MYKDFVPANFEDTTPGEVSHAQAYSKYAGE
jgi:hypothetical protein